MQSVCLYDAAAGERAMDAQAGRVEGPSMADKQGDQDGVGTAPAIAAPAVAAPAVAAITQDERRAMLGQMALRLDDPTGYYCFYELIFNQPIPPHGKEWIEQIYRDHTHGDMQGTLIKAFRGSTKTTTVTIGFVAFRIGHQPNGVHLLVQVGDDIAADNIKAVAAIIEFNPGWKLAFPHVTPDRQQGWGVQGYEVQSSMWWRYKDGRPVTGTVFGLDKDSMVSVSYEEWREINANRKDPSLLGGGYKSRNIIGKHPDCLIVDDIHDDNNTSSHRELQNTLNILQGTIMPTLKPDAWAVFIGTPWVKNDSLAFIGSTGRFSEVSTPVYKKVAPDTAGAVQYREDWVKLTWPGVFSIDQIELRRDLGQTQFARMYLLDLESMANRVFTFFSYPASLINTAAWQGGGGVDYASTNVMFVDKQGKRDYFAIAYGFCIPGGGLVVFDGVVAHASQAQAEQYVERAQNIFPHWRGVCVEGDGKGEEFVSLLMRKPQLRFLPLKTGGKGKDRRLVRQMGPWLESGRLRISDAETPFLNRLRQELNDYPNVEHDDCLDAVYWLCRLFPDVLYVEDAEEIVTQGRDKRRPSRRGNPISALARA